MYALKKESTPSRSCVSTIVWSQLEPKVSSDAILDFNKNQDDTQHFGVPPS